MATARLMTFCRSCEYALVPMKVLDPELEELELLELLLELVPDESDVNEFVVEVRELLIVPINDSRAGRDEMSHPAREGSCYGGGQAPAMAGFS